MASIVGHDEPGGSPTASPTRVKREAFSPPDDLGTTTTQSLPDIRVGKKFRLLEKLGSGSFGDIYRGKDLTSGESVAIKLEPTSCKQPQLLEEARIIKLLCATGPAGVPSYVSPVGIPNVSWYGVEGDYNVMVVDQLGPSLEDLFNYCGRRFSVNTVCMVGKQMVTRLEYMHSKHMIHRDIKPDNFLTGMGRRAGIVYLIDFGLSKPYRDPKSLKHIPFRSGKGLSGTARYASRNTHMGYEQSRRDDLEAIGYVLLYFLRGGLPWQGLQLPRKKQKEVSAIPSPAGASPMSPRRNKAKVDKEREKTERIGQRKLSCGERSLASGHPKEFAEFLGYCGKLPFSSKPDYDLLRGLLEKVQKKRGLTDDGQYDWLTRTGLKSPVLAASVFSATSDTYRLDG
eukprot:TRINITY_DN6787_c0_g1_i4.p1 TRINITY_DN6787_c0_g1~~TRINITY_DN6787_c0_g1_i4.p1  ORF type:complete len:398 (+),score=105.49 TRINITY_DN6787_c0_g1_i4:953-2146(+)